MPLTLTPEHDAAIRAHAALDYPNECCGFLVGRITPLPQGEGGEPPASREGSVTVARTQPAANTRTDSPRNRFEIDPGEMMRVDRQARQDGQGVVGFYHSHPDAPARPSQFDREHAWPGYCYIIVSVISGEPQNMTNWRLRDDRTAFDPDPITINMPL